MEAIFRIYCIIKIVRLMREIINRIIGSLDFPFSCIGNGH